MDSMFKSKNFWYGFFGFLGITFLFYTYDIARFDYKTKKISLSDALEQKAKVRPNITTFSLKEDLMLSTLVKGKVTNYKTIKEILKDKKTLLLIWSPTCSLCPDQMRKLEILKKKFKKINIVMIGTAGNIQEAYKKFNATCSGTFIYDNDPALKLLRLLATDLIESQDIGFPFYVFINQKGEIITRTSGVIPWDVVGEDILKARF